MDAKRSSRMREGFEQQRKAGVNVDWFTWQIAWNDAFFDQRAAILPSDAAPSPQGWKLVPATATDEMLIALLSGGEADALASCKDGYVASRLLQASGVAERFSAMLNAAPVAPAAAAPTLLGSPAEGHWGEPETPSDGHRLESDVDEEAQPDEHAAFGYVAALKIALGVMDQYKAEQPKWWKRMDGTPILNDLPVRMAVAFSEASAGASDAGA